MKINIIMRDETIVLKTGILEVEFENHAFN